MKTCIKYFLILFLMMLFLSGCSGTFMNNGSGTVIIQTPIEIYPSMKSIYNGGNGGTQVVDFNQNYFRYEIIIESLGSRVLYKNFGRDEKGIISGVPTGIPLSIFVGVYYAQNGRSDKELYNVYLATDKIDNVTLMPGESEKLKFKLDVNRSLRVDTYFFDLLGTSINNGIVTGGVTVNSSTNSAYFSIDSFDSENSNVVRYNNDFNNFTVGYFSSLGTAFGNGKGKIFKVDGEPSNYNYWVIYNNAVYFNSAITGSYVLYGDGEFNPVSGFLENVYSIKSITFWDDPYTHYYYFLKHNTGYIGEKCLSVYPDISRENAWNMDTSCYSSYPNDSFILDTLDSKNIVATKVGTFYINNTFTLDNYTGGKSAPNLNLALLNSKKRIKISNPVNPAIELLITDVESYSDESPYRYLIFLGTKRGVYYFDYCDEITHGNIIDWDRFIDPTSDLNVFPEKYIKRLTQIPEESVVSMNIDYVDIGAGTDPVLSVVTTKRICFYNLDTGKADMIDVYDGLPFVPKSQYSFLRNKIDYSVHNIAPVKQVIYDSNANRYWICTDYGLASIDETDLDLF